MTSDGSLSSLLHQHDRDRDGSSTSGDEPETRNEELAQRLARDVSPWRLWFTALSGALICTFLHANDMLFVVVVLLVSYLTTTFVPRRPLLLGGRLNVNVATQWLLGLFVLVATAFEFGPLNFAAGWTLNNGVAFLNAIGIHGVLSFQVRRQPTQDAIDAIDFLSFWHRKKSLSSNS